MAERTSEPIVLCSAERSGDELERFAAEHLLAENVASEMADLFKALADPTRLRIVGLLAQAEICVGDLHAVMGMSQPAISHHLRILRNLRLVKSRKEGRHVYYTLDDEHVESLYSQGLHHVLHD